MNDILNLIKKKNKKNGKKKENLNHPERSFHFEIPVLIKQN